MRMTVLEFVRRAVALRSGNAWLGPEKGWRATFYTTRMEHSPTSANGIRVGTDALARGSGRGDGGSEKGQPRVASEPVRS
jgi:hypothetical protein